MSNALKNMVVLEDNEGFFNIESFICAKPIFEDKNKIVIGSNIYLAGEADICTSMKPKEVLKKIIAMG